MVLKDKYHLKSSISRRRHGVEQNSYVFFDFFNNFYDNIRIRRKPSFHTDMRDPYGFALMCEDYKDMNFNFDRDMTCKEIFEGKGENDNINIPTYVGQFSFKEILNFLYVGFWFDYKKAINVYNNQHNAFDVFHQIVYGNGYIYNRARPELKKSQDASKYAFESIVNLNENDTIHLPHIWKLCDGMTAPFIITKYHPRIQVVKADCHGFGEGIFVISDDKIIDCLKINDTWFTDLPLKHRLFFSHKCTEYEVKPYAEAWNWRSTIDIGKMLGANSYEGVLVRGAHEDFFRNRWFNWSENSIVYCKKNNGELVANARGRAAPEFYNLNGDEAIIPPFEERVHERIYLDDFDIKEFQKIKELKNGD